MEVTFFPRNDYPNNVEVCPHRLGKKMTFVESTTMIPKLVSEMLLPYIVELNQTAHIRIGAHFDNINNGTNSPSASYLGDYVMEQIANNVIWPDLYFLSSPSSDYSKTAILNRKQVLWPWFKNKFGRYPDGIIYGLNANSYGTYLKPYVLATQGEGQSTNSDYGLGVGNPNDIPYSKDFYYLRYKNLRTLDNAINYNEKYSVFINRASDLIDSVMELPKGGFILSFDHIHRVLYQDVDPYTGDVLPGREGLPAVNNGFKAFFNMLAQKNVNDEIYFAGFGEAIDYLVYRESITKTVMYSPVGNENNKLIIRLEAKNLPEGVDKELLVVPMSIKFSLVNTPLEGQSISCNYTLIPLGNDTYIVEVPYSEYPEIIISKK